MPRPIISVSDWPFGRPSVLCHSIKKTSCAQRMDWEHCRCGLACVSPIDCQSRSRYCLENEGISSFGPNYFPDPTEHLYLSCVLGMNTDDLIYDVLITTSRLPLGRRDLPYLRAVERYWSCCTQTVD
ncbi:uncharacterized protein BP01DRAFT_192140 [Aspergillus saccharolyticus JOP 1030-1]|uniref:Uncharacterized protein n=1 Tax=Aspergillus saccharolyticus JOP 1030-1 TaxID=1450539 RepID=A0A318Z0P2_9EURO|nr:hypothetical protein BP01DRAFT_192140 [Aspergillus saccharolyticus JOP 1030-1]PYH40851.1 hypothetical protein BP01DRAFT_192140 [Aspergillus saccharolyticus JOP 1030-1]